MKKSRAVFLLLVLIFAHTIPLFAAPNTATAERYMTSANEQYSLENFAKAYTYINYVLEQYDEKNHLNIGHTSNYLEVKIPDSENKVGKIIKTEYKR